MWVWEMNLCPLQEEHVLLMAESSPQTQEMILKWCLDIHVSVMAR